MTGETFNVCYLDEETKWELIKENFDAINGCKFNGSHRKAFYSANVLVFGGDDDIVSTINDGCQIICEGMEKIQDEHFVDKLDSIE